MWSEVEVSEREFYNVANLSAWHYFYLNDTLKDQGKESENLRLGSKNRRGGGGEECRNKCRIENRRGGWGKENSFCSFVYPKGKKSSR